MAKVVVFFKFADGTTVQAIAAGKTTYPDALATMRAEAVRAFKESMAYALGEPEPASEPMPAIEDES